VSGGQAAVNYEGRIEVRLGMWEWRVMSLSKSRVLEIRGGVVGGLVGWMDESISWGKALKYLSA